MTTPMTDAGLALMPCPFCGSTEVTLDNLADPVSGWFVSCNKCEVQQIANYTETQAVERWNARLESRPPQPVNAAVVEALRRLTSAWINYALRDGGQYHAKLAALKSVIEVIISDPSVAAALAQRPPAEAAPGIGIVENGVTAAAAFALQWFEEMANSGTLEAAKHVIAGLRSALQSTPPSSTGDAG